MELDDVLAAINDGELDGNLDPIVKAMVERVRAEAVEFPWRIRFDGDEWTQETVTLGELKFAEQHCWVDGPTGRRRATRSDLDPRISAEHALALIIAHLHKAQGVALADAVKRAEAITAAELEEIVGEYELVPAAPKAAGPTSTGSSRTASRRTGGSRTKSSASKQA